MPGEDDPFESGSPDDPLTDDPFYTGGGEDFERINAFEIDIQGDWLDQHEFSPGDDIPIRWHDPEGLDYETLISLPESDVPFDDPDYPWDEFYEEMRDFYEDVWGDQDSPTGGSATAG